MPPDQKAFQRASILLRISPVSMVSQIFSWCGHLGRAPWPGLWQSLPAGPEGFSRQGSAGGALLGRQLFLANSER